MKSYIRHKIRNVIDIKWLVAMEYLDFDGKYKNYVEKHNFWEVCYVQEGTAEVNIEGEMFNVNKDELILISPDKVHSYTQLSKEKCRAFVVCFECFSNSLKILSKTHFALNNDLKDCLLKIISEHENTFCMNKNDLLEVVENPNFGGQQAIIIQLEYLFICLMRKMSTDINHEVVFLKKEDFYSELTDVIIDYFKENLNKKLSLELICERLSYSSSFLCKTFKEQTGETLISYFNKMKVDEAKRLFDEKFMSVSEVSRELGFSDTKYFAEFFKKFEGITPSRYKKFCRAYKDQRGDKCD